MKTISDRDYSTIIRLLAVFVERDRANGLKELNERRRAKQLIKKFSKRV